MKKTKFKCVIPRMAKKPKVLFRWLRWKWTARLKAIEKELGEEIHTC